MCVVFLQSTTSTRCDVVLSMRSKWLEIVQRGCAGSSLLLFKQITLSYSILPHLCAKRSFVETHQARRLLNSTIIRFSPLSQLWQESVRPLAGFRSRTRWCAPRALFVVQVRCRQCALVVQYGLDRPNEYPIPQEIPAGL